MFRGRDDTTEYRLSDIIVCETEGKGLGVFSTRSYRKREIIEVSPVILFSHKNFLKSFVLDEAEDLECVEYSSAIQAMSTSTGYPARHIIADYPFSWTDGKRIAMCLGYAGVYNHSYQPNAYWTVQKSPPALIFRAKKDITEGEEICTCYNTRDNMIWFNYVGPGKPLPSIAWRPDHPEHNMKFMASMFLDHELKRPENIPLDIDDLYDLCDKVKPNKTGETLSKYIKKTP
jgi:hypothetical protein